MKQFLYIWVAAVCLNAPIFGEVLHAILFLDTEAKDLREGVLANYELLLDEFIRIQMYTGLEVHVHPFIGSELEQDITIRIDEIKVQEEDVVFFYCSSHGHRFQGVEDPWPVFVFSAHFAFVPQEEITTLLLAKRPRFLISMSDTCNSFLLGRPELLVAASFFDPKKVEEALEENYQRLFLDQTGCLRIASASPGEKAYVGLAGGIFTRCFLKALHMAAQQEEEVSWPEILRVASEATSAMIPGQHPFFTLDE